MTVDSQVVIEPALTEALQAVFAKQSFREGQLDALVEVMRVVETAPSCCRPAVARA